jgi:arginase family enzyme
LNQSKIVILPVHSQAAGTPAQIVLALRNVEAEDLSKIRIDILAELSDVEQLYEASRNIIQPGKFLVTLGDEGAITPILVKAQLEKWPSMKVLQIDAQVIRQVDQDPEWFVKVVDDLPEHVYFTLNVDRMNLDEVTWRELMNLMRELTHRRNIVGLDLIASAPQDEQSLYCAKLLHEILGYIF